MKLPRPSDQSTDNADNSCDELRQVKEASTNHWDMDMLTREQLDELAAISRRKHRAHVVKMLSLGFVSAAAAAALAVMVFQLF